MCPSGDGQQMSPQTGRRRGGAVGGPPAGRPHLVAASPARPAPRGSQEPGLWRHLAIGKAAPGATRRGDERRVAGGGRLQRQVRAGSPAQRLGTRWVRLPGPAGGGRWPGWHPDASAPWLSSPLGDSAQVPSLSGHPVLGLVRSLRCVPVVPRNNDFDSLSSVWRAFPI